MHRLLTVAAALGLAMGAAPLAGACENCKSEYKQGTYLGGVTRVGNGSAYSWVTLNEKGKPSALGITLTETALAGLPTKAPDGAIFLEYPLGLPKQADKTPFDHVVLNWNPQGHIPPGIYTVPHFDMHFYTITEADRARITLKGDDLARCQKTVPATYMAPGYIRAPGGEEPMMGAHWVDLSCPEFKGQPFTKSMLFGSYDGKPIFTEPMVTLEFLTRKTDVSESIKQAPAVMKSGFYPTAFTIRHDPVRHEVHIAMGDMKWREASPSKPIPPQSAAR